MFRITKGTSSGSITQYLAKITRNGSVVSVDMDAAYSARGACTTGRNMLPEHRLRPCQRTRQNHFL